MPSQMELDLAASRAQVKALESEIESSHKKIERLSRNRDDDVVRKEMAQLNVSVGELNARLRAAEEERGRLERELRGNQAARQAEKEAAAMSQAAQKAQLEEAVRASERSNAALRQNQLILVGRTWMVHLWPALFVLACVGAYQYGIMTLKTGDAKVDTDTLLNQLVWLGQHERNRATEMQRPFDVWGIRKCASSDGKAIFSLDLYSGVQVPSEASARQFASSLILAALRMHSSVLMTKGGNRKWMIVDAQTGQEVIYSEYLNRVLGESGRALIASKAPDFGLSVNVECLDAEEADRYLSWSIGFQDGKFVLMWQQAKKGGEKGGEGKG